MGTQEILGYNIRQKDFISIVWFRKYKAVSFLMEQTLYSITRLVRALYVVYQQPSVKAKIGPIQLKIPPSQSFYAAIKQMLAIQQSFKSLYQTFLCSCAMFAIRMSSCATPTERGWSVRLPSRHAHWRNRQPSENRKPIWQRERNAVYHISLESELVEDHFKTKRNVFGDR